MRYVYYYSSNENFIVDLTLKRISTMAYHKPENLIKYLNEYETTQYAWFSYKDLDSYINKYRISSETNYQQIPIPELDVEYIKNIIPEEFI